MKRRSWIFLILIWGSVAQARVFDINKESFAAYFLGSVGSSALGTKPIEKDSSAALNYSGNINYNYSGEFGFIYAKPVVSFRFAMEILKPTALDSAVKSSSVDYYSAKNDILGYIPKVALEFNLHGNQSSRSYVSFAGGLANIKMTNEYTFTAAGTSALGVSDHTTESKGTGTLLSGAIGYENILTDTTTIAIEMGYRQLKVDNMQYTKDVSTFGGAKSTGDSLKNADGSVRSLDFSGGYLSLGFRFYL